MDLRDIIKLAGAYADLGTMIQEQIEAVVIEGEPIDDQNPAAMEYFDRWLDEVDRAAQRGLDEDLRDEIANLRLREDWRA